jgi:hypothetical protein
MLLADPEPKKTRSEAYLSLYAMNEGFDRISECLQLLESRGIILPQYAQSRILLTEEYRAELNHILTGLLKDWELKEWAALASKRS